MFQIDTSDVKKLESHLKAFHHRALPFATKETLNTMAFQAQKDARRTIKIDMVNRNKFTQQSIQVDMARGMNVRRQQSAFGSTQAYMLTQEFGGTKRKRGKVGTPIATSESAGQRGTRPRTRLPTRANRLQNILLSNKRTKGKNQRQRNAIKIRIAAEQGIDHVMLKYGNNRAGIFRVKGDDSGVSEVRMIHDLSRDSVRIPRSPWMRPAADYVQTRVGRYYRDALQFQLKRRGVKLKLI